MSNHKWQNDVCLNCGVKREMKDFKRWQRVEGVLRNGVWEDKHFFTYGIKFWYGEKYRFERPQCELVKLKII